MKMKWQSRRFEKLRVFGVAFAVAISAWNDSKCLADTREDMPLKGFKVALDPGHLGGEWAILEKRFMKFNGQSTVLKEGDLNFYVATEISKKLAALGSEVLITRKFGKSSLSVQFNDWLKNITEIQAGIENVIAEYPDIRGNSELNFEVKLLKKTLTKRKPIEASLFSQLYNSVYLKLDLQHRADLINEFNPAIAFVIHFNSDRELVGKNSPVQTNYNSAYVLKTNYATFRNSVRLCEVLVKNFVLSTGVPQRKTELKEYILGSKETYASEPMYNQFFSRWSTGVYNNDLVLTRNLKGTFCYGESLFQDNETEAINLATENKWRLNQVVAAYVNTAVQFLTAHP
jgi:N-acetylmuramoyl-L-alanine amidase